MAAVAVHRLMARPLPALPLSALLLPVLLLPGWRTADAHVPDADVAPAWTLAWTFEPWVVASLVLSAALYTVGLRRLWGRAGPGRGVSARHAAAFAAGWVALVVALVSPIDPLGNRLFSAHMLQHELLMVVAAPLLVVGKPLAVWVWALPVRRRRTVGGFFHRPAWRIAWLRLTSPLYAWLVHALALWLWHVPVLFEAALRSNAVHTLQHFSFLFTALLFWWSALGQSERAAQGTAMIYLFTTMVHSSILGALLTLSPFVWYPTYGLTAPALGLSALEDQQLGGLVMWIPAGIAYLAAGLVLAMRWIGFNRQTAGG